MVITVPSSLHGKFVFVVFADINLNTVCVCLEPSGENGLENKIIPIMLCAQKWVMGKDGQDLCIFPRIFNILSKRFCLVSLWLTKQAKILELIFVAAFKHAYMWKVLCYKITFAKSWYKRCGISNLPWAPLSVMWKVMCILHCEGQTKWKIKRRKAEVLVNGKATFSVDVRFCRNQFKNKFVQDA